MAADKRRIFVFMFVCSASFLSTDRELSMSAEPCFWSVEMREERAREVSFSQSLFLSLAPFYPKHWHFKKRLWKMQYFILYLFSGTKNQPVRLYIQPEWPCFVVFQQSNVQFDPLFTFVGLATQSDTPVWTNLNLVLIISVLWVTCEKHRNISLSFDQECQLITLQAVVNRSTVVQKLYGVTECFWQKSWTKALIDRRRSQPGEKFSCSFGTKFFVHMVDF